MRPSYYAGEVVDGQLYVVTGYAAATANQVDGQAIGKATSMEKQWWTFSTNIRFVRVSRRIIARLSQILHNDLAAPHQKWMLVYILRNHHEGPYILYILIKAG